MMASFRGVTESSQRFLTAGSEGVNADVGMGGGAGRGVGDAGGSGADLIGETVNISESSSSEDSIASMEKFFRTLGERAEEIVVLGRSSSI